MNGGMEKLSKVLIIAAIICLVVAVSIKAVTLGQLMPGRMPINWVKIADTVLLFSIAISLLAKK